MTAARERPWPTADDRWVRSTAAYLYARLAPATFAALILVVVVAATSPLDQTDPRLAAVLASIVALRVVPRMPRVAEEDVRPAVPVDLDWADLVLVDLGDGAVAHQYEDRVELRVGLPVLVNARRDAVVAAALGQPLTARDRETVERLAWATSSGWGIWRLYGRIGLHLSAHRPRDRGPFAEYWIDDVIPCITAGFAPPIVDGWLRSTDPREHTLPPPAVDLDRVERGLLEAVRDTGETPLVPIDLAQVAMAVWAPEIADHAAEFSEALAEFTVADTVVAAARNDTEAWATGVACALVTTLIDMGWTLVGTPGDFRVAGDDASVDPFGLARSAQLREASDAEWRAFADDLGIADRALAFGSLARAAGAVDDLPTAVRDLEPQRIVIPRTERFVRDMRSEAYVWAFLLIVSTALFAGVFFVAPEEGARPWIGGTWAVWSAAIVLNARGRLRVAFSTALLTIDADGLSLEDPALLRGPLRVRRESVVSATFDEYGPDDRRFATNPGDPEAGAWLWERDELSLVPLHGAGDEIPNVAFTFASGVVAPRVRRRSAAGVFSQEALGGLLLAVPDPATVRGAMRVWGVHRGLSAEDLHRVTQIFAGVGVEVGKAREKVVMRRATVALAAIGLYFTAHLVRLLT